MVVPLNYFIRIVFVATVAVLLSLAGCRNLKVEDVSTLAVGDWREDGGNTVRNRFVSADFAFPLEEAWHVNAAAAFGPGSPLLIGETLVVGTRRGDLYAIKADQGQKIGSERFGESIEGSLLMKDGIVYIPTSHGKSSITAYDLSRGKKLWEVRGAPFESGFVVLRGILIGVDIAGVVWGRDRTNGLELWSFKLDDGSSGQTAPLELADGSVVIAGDRGLVIMLDPDSGSILWNSVLPAPIHSSPIAEGTLIYVSTTKGELYALSQVDGTVSWSTRLGNRGVHVASAGADGTDLYVGTSNGQFYALNATTGEIEWIFEGPHAFTAPPLITARYVFIGSMGRKLYAFERSTNTLVWETELGGRIKSAMAARDGELFVLAEPRHIYKFVSVEEPHEEMD